MITAAHHELAARHLEGEVREGLRRVALVLAVDEAGVRVVLLELALDEVLDEVDRPARAPREHEDVAVEEVDGLGRQPAVELLGVVLGGHLQLDIVVGRLLRDAFLRHCPGRKPAFLAVKRPARPYKSPIQNRFT
jgi:hypothetical protein